MSLARFAFLIPVCLLAFACGNKEESCKLDPEILNQDLNVTVTRLEDEFFAAKSAEDVSFLLEKYPDFARVYFQSAENYSPDSLAANLLAVHQDSAMRELYDSVKVEYPDISDIEKDLENAFKYITHHFPDFKAPKVYTFVSGLNSDLVVTEDVIVIG